MKISKRIMGSLAARVLLVSTALLVIPLVLNTLVLYRHDYILKMRELFGDLNMIGLGRELLLEDNLYSRAESIDLIEMIIQDKTPEERELLLQQVKKEQALTSIDFFQGETKACIPRLDIDPKSGTKVILIERPTKGGVVQIGISAQNMIEHLSYHEGGPYPFHLALLNREGELFVQENPSLQKSDLRIYSLDDIKKRSFFSRLINKEGSHLGLSIPIEGTEMALVVAVPEQAVSEVKSQGLTSRITSIFFLTLLLGGALAFWVTRRMARPLKDLCQVMERIGKGDFKARFKNDPMGFEINVLGNDFNNMIDSLITHMEEAKNERIARVLLANELKIGKEIQMSILPREMPQLSGLEIAAGLQPAKEVAGDFYDVYYKKEQNKLMFSIADASGKGVSACLYSLCVRSLLRSFTASHEDFAETIRLTNQLFCQDTADTGSFVTAWVGHLDIATKRLSYCSLGHPPALLKRKNGTLEDLSTPNPALGVMEFDQVQVAETYLFPGDILLLYTDGLIEAHNPQMQIFGKERLHEIMAEIKDEAAQELVSFFMKKVAVYEKGAAQFDDLTLLAIRIL